MSTFSLLLGLAFLPGLISLPLMVIFGQTTMRKLRRNPSIKHELGLEFASGWDILNVAQALATPQKIHKILENGQLSFLYANSEAIAKHTNRFDKVLAIIFFWLFMGSGVSMLALVILEKIGVFAS